MADGLRVAIVTGEYPPMEGGVADYTRILAEHLARLGAEVHVITDRRASEGVHAPGPVACHAEVRRWGWRGLLGVARRVGWLGAEVVNVQYQTAAYGLHPAVNLLPLALRTPVVATFHDLRVPYLFPKAGPLRWRTNLALARAAAACITTNAEDHAALSAALPAARRPHLVPIGSNVPCAPPADYDRAAWRQRRGLAPDALVMAYFGFLNASKGGEDLVEALAGLARAGLDAHLMMIGGSVGASDPTNRAYLESVRGLVASHGVADRVQWTGYLSDEEVSAAFLSSDLCVLPYRDGASYRRGSLMAALEHGLPIVTTHPTVEQPGLAHGENAWLVPPGDPAALAEACTLLWRDADLRRRIARGARGLGQRFSWADIASQTLEVYRDALASSRICAPR